MSDNELGKKLVEREHLDLFLWSYARVTGEEFTDIIESETPDFLARDDAGNTIGIEIVRLKFRPDIMWWRRTFDRKQWIDHNDAHWRIIEILDRKESKLGEHSWRLCKRKMLVIVLIDSTLEELAPNMETDSPDGSSFDEIWLADYTQVEPFGGVDLFPIVHPQFEGLFNVASRDKKPYG